MKKKISRIPVKIFGLIIIFTIAVFFFVKAVNKMGEGQEAESLKQLDSSIRKATLTCYATEGVYPPTIEYLEKNYGIQVDKEQFTVFYEIFGDNMMPDITVMEKQ